MLCPATASGVDTRCGAGRRRAAGPPRSGRRRAGPGRRRTTRGPAGRSARPRRRCAGRTPPPGRGRRRRACPRPRRSSGAGAEPDVAPAAPGLPPGRRSGGPRASSLARRVDDAAAGSCGARLQPPDRAASSTPSRRTVVRRRGPAARRARPGPAAASQQHLVRLVDRRRAAGGRGAVSGQRRLARPARAPAPSIHVGVDPAEPERVDRRPGAAPSLSHGRAAVDRREPGRAPAAGCGVVAVQGGRQHPVVHRERGLDQAGDAGGRHGVADHRLHRADHRRGPPAVRAEHLAPASSSSARVAGRGAGAVRLQQAQRAGRGRVEPGGRQARRMRQRPARPDRGLTRLAARPSLDTPGPADHRVDPVAVALARRPAA